MKWPAGVLAVAATAAAGLAAWQATGWWWTPLPAAAVAIAGLIALRGGPPPGPDTGTMEDVEHLLRGVYEVSAELVGCSDETDARDRFAHALGRFWRCARAELWIWDRGHWRCVGDGEAGAPPELDLPVRLPGDAGRDLALDLSAGVSGQAAIILRDADVQPSLSGRRSPLQRDVAEILRGQFALCLRRVMRHAELRQLARRDGLTGAWRRWYGDARLAELVEHGEAVAVLMVDIDRFKDVNDRFGHAAGDRVLAAVGACLLANVRAGDLVCRHGGEEFLAILPRTDAAGTRLVAERMRAAVAALAGLPARATVSIGAATCRHEDTAGSLLARADQAMLRAKEAGRDRVELAEDLPGTTRRHQRPHSEPGGVPAVAPGIAALAAAAQAPATAPARKAASPAA